jgi:ketosteroid isomerase-like protein
MEHALISKRGGEDDYSTRLVNRYYELIDIGDFEGVFKLFHEDIIYERGGTPTIHGIDALKGFYRAGRIIQDGRHEIQAVVSQGDWVGVRGVFRGTLKTGERVEVRFADFHQIKENKIWKRYSYFMDRFV